MQASPSGNNSKRPIFLEFTQTLRRFNADGAQGADEGSVRTVALQVVDDRILMAREFLLAAAE